MHCSDVIIQGRYTQPPEVFSFYWFHPGIFIVSFLLFWSLPELICAQPEREFIRNYNEHLDPGHRLDSLHVFKVTSTMTARGRFNNHLFSISDDIWSCLYYSNGDQKCTVSKTGANPDMGSVLPNMTGHQNAMKYHLNFISEQGDSVEFALKAKNDSITIVSKELGASQRFVFTFNSKTMDLIQIENQAMRKGKKYNSVTSFQAYQKVKGILVPARMTFSNDFCTVTLEYSDVEFE